MTDWTIEIGAIQSAATCSAKADGGDAVAHHEGLRTKEAGRAASG